MPSIPLQSNILTVKRVVSTGSVRTDAASLDKLATHKAILEAHGITDLAALGTLSFKATVVPQPGLVRPAFVRFGGPFTAVPAQFTTVGISKQPPAPVGKPKQPPAPAGISKQPPAPAGISKLASAPAHALDVVNFTTAQVQVQGAHRLVIRGTKLAAPTSELVSGMATKVIGKPLVGSQGFSSAGVAAAAAMSAASIPINTAYWVASTINLADDTTIVIQSNIRYLVIIANTITVGTNVTLAYDPVPVANPPGVPAKPPAPSSSPATPGSFSTGYAGYGGAPGTQPMQIGTVPNAPEVELWTLAINSLPTVNLKGQKGYTGVRGGDGADGGRGGNGSDSVPQWLNCASGPGSGGQGGKGGRGGTGGAGGNGGMGGRWSLYTTSAAILALPGFLIDVSGGDGGDGGPPGTAGQGGPGGDRGGVTGYCANFDWSDRTNGSAGPSGDPGSPGPNGAPGTPAGPDAEKFVTIDANDFLNKLTDPAITSVNPPIATVGATVTISGLRFTPTDEVKVGGVAATSTFVADTMLQCVVPNAAGGLSYVQVTRAGGSQGSNYGTLWITPVVLSTIPASPANRLRPGTTVRILGTGFSPQTTVRVNGTDIATVTFIDTQTIDFVMKRPDSVPYDPNHASGEPALLSVASSGPILASNSIPIVIATYQMVVLGDSIAWGEGLQDQDKFSTLVGNHVTAANANISVYINKSEPHTGATLGWNDANSGPAYDGDVPETYPTIKHQAKDAAGSPNAATVDLILVSATANDVGFVHFLDPSASQADILSRVTQFCHHEMHDFLVWLAGAFPAAKIIATGYYAGISMDSDPTYLVDLVGVMYGLENNKGLGPELLAASIGLSSLGQTIIASNSAYFATQANLAITAAVQEGNTTLGTARLFFADPGFGPKNAAMASDAWVFGLSKSLDVLQPTDSPPAANRRIAKCRDALSNFTDRMFCELASTGHPNETGAQHYAAAIVALL